MFRVSAHISAPKSCCVSCPHVSCLPPCAFLLPPCRFPISVSALQKSFVRNEGAESLNPFGNRLIYYIYVYARKTAKESLPLKNFFGLFPLGLSNSQPHFPADFVRDHDRSPSGCLAHILNSRTCLSRSAKLFWFNLPFSTKPSMMETCRNEVLQ